jgi:hypothetical protein
VAELVVAVLVLIWLVAMLDNVVAGGGGDDVAVAELLGKVGLAGGGDDVAIAEVLGNTVLVGGEDVDGRGDDEASGVDEEGDIQAASQ